MNTRNVTNTAFTSYPATAIELPNGRQLTNTYDALYRRTLVQDITNGVNVAAWQFFGPSRVAEVNLGNGLICTWMNNARTNSAVQPAVANPAWGNQSSDRLGYDGAGRPITKRYLAGGINGTTHAYNTPASVAGFTTEYDLASNKFYERALHAPERSNLYEPFSNGSPTGGYDSLNRLRQYQRGVLTSDDGFGGNGGGSVATPIALPNTDTQRTYDLDSLGNWRRTVYTPEGGSQQTEVRQHNGLNEITRIQTNGGTPTSLSYDGVAGASNGNLKNDGTRSYTWDALNRLVQVNRVSDGAIIGQYVYDAMNRRIRKTVSNGGLSGTIPNGTTDCIYSGWRCIEERNGSNATTLQYIWGIYLDELLQIYAYSDFGSQPLSSGAYYPLQDLLYRTTALTNSSGSIVEAYDTDAYGNTLIFSAPGTGGNWWADNAATAAYPACPFIFTGQRFDAESQTYYYKRRLYVPQWGRFASRDPSRTGSRDAGLYELADGRPSFATDPSGLNAVDVINNILDNMTAFLGTKQSWVFCTFFPPSGLCVCASATVSYDIKACCHPPVTVCSILQVSFGIGLYSCPSVQIGFSTAPPIANWSHPDIRLTPKGVLSNLVLRHTVLPGYGCPPEGNSGQICIVGSIGWRSWTFGAQACVHFPGGRFVADVGMGIGYGTGISGTGGYTRTDCIGL